MRFGVHVSIGGGFLKALAQARTLGCEAFQIFAGSPRGWARKPLEEAEAAAFRAALATSGLGPVVVHLSYLPNPATADPVLLEKSRAALLEDFIRANRLDAGYFVMHPGSCPAAERASGLARVIESVEEALAKTQGPTMLLLENQGGKGKDVAADLKEMAALLRHLDRRRVGLCLDTCHTFVAGYELRSDEAWGEVLRLLDGEIGLERLRVIHANDSKGDLGSGLDRHEHIGHGFLAAEAFAAMGRQQALADMAVILETPQDGPEDDSRNLARIRALTAGKP